MSGHGQASGPQTFDSPGNVPKHQKTVWLEQTVQAETPASDVVVDANSQKALDVLKACDRGAHRDELAALATSELGLGNDQARQRAWPALLGFSDEAGQEDESWHALPSHKDEDQVSLDVNRSFIYYPKDQSEKQLEVRKAQLSDLIVRLLRSHSMLCYFQGFHDIAQVFLLVLGDQKAFRAVEFVSLLRIRDFMLPSMSASLDHLRLLPAILLSVDPDLYGHVSTTQPFFALAATLTLYAHDIEEYADIARLLDYFLAQPAVMPVYFFAVIILARKKELLEIPKDEPEMLHAILSKLPKPLDLEALISRSMTIFTRHPPENLPQRVWRKISRYSVLKTTRDSREPQTLDEGEKLFKEQAEQIRRNELRKRLLLRLWKIRRSLGAVGLAILVAAVGFWLQKGPNGGLFSIGVPRVLKFWRLFRQST